MALTQEYRGMGQGGEGQVTCPHKSISMGSAWRAEWVAEWVREGGEGIPSLQAMASFPSSTQTAAGTGQGLLLKHLWLQALMIPDAWGLRIFLGSLFFLIVLLLLFLLRGPPT